MPNMLFASNSVSHFPGAVIGPDPWSFDSTRVPYSIECPNHTPCGSPFFEESTTDEYWFHFRHGSDNWTSNDDENIIEINDFDGNRIFQLSYQNRDTSGYSSRFTVDGVESTSTRYYPMRTNGMRTYDIQLKWTALNAEARVYMNEILVETMIIVRTSFTHPRKMIFGGREGGSHVSNFTGEDFISEIIVADGDTRNARLDLLRPVAAGAYGDWLGPITSLSDDDPTTGMTTLDPDQNQSTILSPYTGAHNISNIVQLTTTVRGLNSPENLRHLIRISGVDHLSPATYAIPFEKAYQVTDWGHNPATSLPWSSTELTNAEWGFRSLA